MAAAKSDPMAEPVGNNGTITVGRNDPVIEPGRASTADPANVDSMTELSSNSRTDQQPAAIHHQSASTGGHQAASTYRSASGKLARSISQSSAAPNAELDHAAQPDNIGADVAAVAEVDDEASLSGSQTSACASSQADQLSSLSQAASASASNAEDQGEHNAASAAPAMPLEHDSLAQQPQDHQDLTERPVTDSVAGSSKVSEQAEGFGGKQGGGGRHGARTPLAAVQEAATPMLGSLSFKQAPVPARQGNGEVLLC